MAQSECNIGVGKEPLLLFSAPIRDCCGNALDSLRNANLPWPLFFKRGNTMKLRELKNCLEEIIPLFSKGG